MTLPRTRAQEQVNHSLDLLAAQLKNETGKLLYMVQYQRGHIDTRIAGGDPAPAWVVERIDRIAKKYSEPFFQWEGAPATEKDADNTAKEHKPTIREEWAKLNGVLAQGLTAVIIKPRNGQEYATIGFMVGSTVVQWADIYNEPAKYAKQGREFPSNVACVKVGVHNLVKLLAGAVSKQQKVNVGAYTYHLEKWGNRPTISLRYTELGKSGLRTPSDKPAPAPKEHKPRASKGESMGTLDCSDF